METKKIIITGGATRIGKAIALGLANYNTQIVIHYSKSFNDAKKLKKELENLGSIVHLLKADLNNHKQTQKIISNAYKKMKGLNCLVNNASVFENDNLYNFSNTSFSKHTSSSGLFFYFPKGPCRTSNRASNKNNNHDVEFMVRVLPRWGTTEP